MTKASYPEWLKHLEKLEREQRMEYAAGREKEGDDLGNEIKLWICDGRSKGYSAPDGRPQPQ